MNSACQSFNGRNTRAAARPLARIIRQFILGKLPILSALRSGSLFVCLSPFHDVNLLRRSRSYILRYRTRYSRSRRHYQQNVDQS
jgi:hypothetical protein